MSLPVDFVVYYQAAHGDYDTHFPSEYDHEIARRRAEGDTMTYNYPRWTVVFFKWMKWLPIKKAFGVYLALMFVSWMLMLYFVLPLPWAWILFPVLIKYMLIQITDGNANSIFCALSLTNVGAIIAGTMKPYWLAFAILRSDDPIILGLVLLVGLLVMKNAIRQLKINRAIFRVTPYWMTLVPILVYFKPDNEYVPWIYFAMTIWGSWMWWLSPKKRDQILTKLRLKHAFRGKWRSIVLFFDRIFRKDYADTDYGRIYLPRDDRYDLVAQHIRRNEVYQAEIVYEGLRYIKPYSTVMDVGANYGQMSLIWSCVENVNVWGFEPQRDLDVLLAKTLPYPTFFLMPYCATNRDEIVFVEIPPEARTRGNYGMTHNEGNAEPVMGVTIDSLNTHNKPISFIKIDTEGADLLVMMGARKTILRDKPAIIFEFKEERALRFNHRWSDYKDFVHDIGYEFVKTIDGDNYLILPNKPKGKKHDMR